MLIQLSIRDIVLIERLDLVFESGLSVLTGETGAGKSILLDSLSLALGGRGDGGLVRHGEDRGQVTAVFDVGTQHPARKLLRENGIDDDGDLIFRRVQSADGRTKAFVNDQALSVQLMRQIGQLLVEIHGQHDDRALVDTDAHRTLLDAFAGLADEAQEVGKLYRVWRDTDRTLKKHTEQVEKAAREADFLRASVEELEKLSPQDGEEDELAEKRSRMMKAERIAGDIAEASEFLNGNASPVPHIASLVRRLERKSHEAPGLLEDTVALLDAALDQLSNAQMEVEAALRKTEYDPRELERVEERLFALRAASRKYSVPVTELPALAERMVSDLADLDAGEERLARLATELAAAKADYDAAARGLSEKRRHAGEALAEAVMAELPALKLERARFMVEITSDPEAGTADGIDVVEFHVQTNPGTRPGPITKVASGGELSRFLLALKVALADRGSAPTLVFDEIDTGVGGAVADAIGQRLKRLSDRVQVLSVTHAPQVAARAATHLLISKGPVADGSEKISTRVATMEPKDRTEEIARMLAGASVTEEARAAAKRLLAGNG
ncbi:MULTISPECIES: DNA repair protein RecN [unclassified Rhizobium]|uniref:DNA repair protein RecN n=1 Tax=unclassified Rhizobium TaxID=2613769 RepID=UPI000DDF4592|nr:MULTISPECIES: DNA repair protein RecN [unclassified Rhizobium]MBB3285881.1 DNA repair protein RecN (Recombination protein N) [Rhizobium sp. BK252]MBB3400957.1 DNA repair protein RecN (Recombination protein N) [Rhizobium sp. BK289]MBB3413199.1 DNA repair protein RecN (Recombination protein N) [Rhizobium sp. BK284]MBB3481423.1 DNA repair protein RecN (Recombination protein N) [Rhizobium sp. BK347]MDK4723253.1 DNA repair protein RecN [Rhizobium sp. CNPSo 3968]